MNVVLVGEEAAGAQTLKLLASSSYHVTGVVTTSPSGSDPGSNAHRLAQKLGIRTWPTSVVKDPAFADVLRAERVDLLLNVHSLCLIDGNIVAAARHGSYNLHPGPLPRYAGLNAPSWAIYHDEKTHGVTLHKMTAGIDTGPVAYQTLLPIDDRDTGFSLSAKCAECGMELISRLLTAAARHPQDINLSEQDLAQRSYFGKDTPQSGWLVWSRPARAVFNFVRAADYSPFHSPWECPRSRLGSRQIAFVKVGLTGQPCDATPGTVGAVGPQGAQVACADEWVLAHRLLVDERRAQPHELLRQGDRLEWDEPTRNHHVHQPRKKLRS